MYVQGVMIRAKSCSSEHGTVYRAGIVGGEEGERWLLRRSVPWARAQCYVISLVEKEAWTRRSTRRLKPPIRSGPRGGFCNGVVVNAPKAQYRGSV